MKKLISAISNAPWAGEKNVVETFILNDGSYETPPTELCSSAYAFVFKEDYLLQTELRKGERDSRQLDIPGGHTEQGETPEQTAVRETYEETGVRINNLRLIAYMKVTMLSEKPDNFPYPYPVSYLFFYLAEVEEEFPFNGNDEVHGRVWLSKNEFKTSEWCVKNQLLLQEILGQIN